MSMRLTKSDLTYLLGTLAELENLSADVQVLRMAGESTPHDVYVKRREDGSYVIVGITEKVK